MIISTKIGQTSFISEEGKRYSATVLDYNSCSVVGNRTQEKDGYIANILGYLKPKKLNKPQLKDFNKKNIEPKKIIKEQRLLTEDNLLDIGSEVEPTLEPISNKLSSVSNLCSLIIFFGSIFFLLKSLS